MSDRDILPVTLETERLRLRRLQSSDAEDIFEYASNPEATRYVFWNTHTDLEQTRRYIDSFDRPRSVAWALEQKSSGRVIGICFLHSIDPHRRKAELAFNISHHQRNKGYATEAARRVVQHCFDETPLVLVEGTCMLDNAPSARVLEKTGLVFRHIQPRSRRKNGVLYDLRYYSISREDYLRSQSRKVQQDG